MKRLIGYDFTNCDLDLLKDVINVVSEERQKALLGAAICDWMSHYASSDYEVRETLEELCPTITKVTLVFPTGITKNK